MLAFEHSDMRKYLLGVYYTVVTITTVGFGDITPSNQCSSRSPDEKMYVCFLIVVGVFFYTNTLSFFSTTFIDEK